MRYKRNHPVFVLEGIYKLIPLFVFPLARGFAFAIRGGFFEWLGGAWADVSVVLIIVLLAILRWNLTQYAFDGENISVKGGLVIFREKTIPIEKICSVIQETPWFFRPFSATRIRVDTLAGTRNRADVSLTLPTSVAVEIITTIEQKINVYKTTSSKTVSPKFLKVMIVSAFLSDSFAGAGFTALFLSRMGKLVGEELEKRVTDTLNDAVRSLSFKIPPVLTATALIILGGWLVGFVQNLLRHQKLTLCRKDDFLLIKGGIITPRRTMMRVETVGFITVKQRLFMKILGVYTVFANCVGVGKRNEDITTIAPAGDREGTDESFATLFPEFERAKITVKPSPFSIFRFIVAPLCFCVGIPTAVWLLTRLYSRFGEIFLFLGLMSFLPSCRWLLVRIADFKTSGIGVNEKAVTLKYSKLLQLNTVIIPWDKIISVKIRQSPFQRLDARCDVFVHTKGETTYRHRVRNADVEKARKMLRVK